MWTTGIRRTGCFYWVLLSATLAACGSASVGLGYYRVVRGDTVGRIARINHQSVYNITRWNDLANPDAIAVGQVLRVAPSVSESQTSVTARRLASERRAERASSTLGEEPPVPTSSISFVWPARGTIVHGFNGDNVKGIDIGNIAGTPVVAAAAGEVVYASNGLPGYGNMIIIKHNANYLSAYAHNRILLVREGQRVAQGQQIAEMGDSGGSRVMLHFEVRYQGRSVDPMRYLSER